MAQRGYPRYTQDNDLYNKERQRHPADRDGDFEDNDPSNQERQQDPADRDSGFRDSERRPEPCARYGRDVHYWRQLIIRGPDSAPASGGSCESRSEVHGFPDGHLARQETPHEGGRPRHDPGPARGGGHVLGGPPRRDYTTVFDIGPGRLPRMDGPALGPWYKEPPRWSEGLGNGNGAERLNERRDDIERLFRVPPTTGREYRELIAAPRGGGESYRGSGGAGGGRDEGLPPGAGYVRPKSLEEGQGIGEEFSGRNSGSTI